MASAAQVGFIQRLAQERVVPEEMGPVVASPDALVALPGQDASRLIETLKACQRRDGSGGPVAVQVTEPGMYQRDGEVYKVQRARGSDRLYAKRLVVIGGRRLRDADEARVNFEFEYDRGAVFRLEPGDRMSQEQARAFGIRYGVCCVCGITLKDAESVARGIGPVCGGRV